jgi:hypothetical protein
MGIREGRKGAWKGRTQVVVVVVVCSGNSGVGVGE